MANKDNDDVISYCGSLARGSISSARRRGKVCTLPREHASGITSKLKNLAWNGGLPDLQSGFQRTRFNTVFHSYRFVVAIFGGLSMGLVMLLRLNISVAMLKMVNQTELYLEEHPDATREDFLAEGYELGGEFNWSNEIQQMIMSWYMIAYTIPQVPLTKLGSVVGSRLFVPISLGLCAISSLLLPSLAYYGWQWVVATRLLNGIGAAAVLPLLVGLVQDWMPYDQMTLGLTYSQIVQSSLMAASPIIAGFLSSIHWKWAFYGPAAVTIVFCVLWVILITDRPDDNWLVSQKEVQLICGCSDTDGYNDNQADDIDSVEDETQRKFGWSYLLTGPTLYIYILLEIIFEGSEGCFFFVLPTYLRAFLKIPVAENGFFCFIVTIGAVVSVTWPHSVCKLIQDQFGTSETRARKIVYAFVCIVPAATWIYVGWANDSQIMLFFVNRAFHGSNAVLLTGTLMSNYAKLGLSSLAFSVVNAVGNFTIAFSSPAAGWALDHMGQDGWFWIFVFMGASQAISIVLFSTCIKAGPIDAESRRQSKGAKDNMNNVESGLPKADGKICKTTLDTT